MGKKPILKNLIIEPIMLSAEQIQQLDKIMKSKNGSCYKKWKLRKTMTNIGGSAGGLCCSCRELPTHILKYHVSVVI